MGVAELIVRAMAVRGVGLATAARRTADIVLTADRTGMQRAQREQFAFDGGDALVDLALGHGSRR